MSSYKLLLPEQVAHVSMSASEDALAVLFRSGLVQVWDLGTRLPEAGASRLLAGAKPAEPKLRWEQRMAPEGEFIAKQVCLGGNGEVAAIFWADDLLLRVANANEVWTEEKLLPVVQHVAWEAEAGWLVAERDGVLRGIDESRPLLVPVAARPQSVAIAQEACLIFSLSDTGRLVASSLTASYGEAKSATLASAVTSFTLTPDFLIYTTSAQSSHYAPFSSVLRVLAGEDVGVVRDEEWDMRRVERGALAVAACPSSMSLVLQMPRGNLETVYPRALVLAVVRRDVLA
jgi:elongator complex protein 1